MESLILKMHTNPKLIFNLPVQPDTYIEVDMDHRYSISAENMFSRCGWTPFEGYPVSGSVIKVILRGKEAYKQGKILVQPGYGENVRKNN